MPGQRRGRIRQVLGFGATGTSNGPSYATGSLSCLSCLSVCDRVTLVYCGQTVGRIKMSLGTEVGLGPGDIVLNGDPAPPQKGTQQLPHFSAHVYCGQTVVHLGNC